MQIQIMAVSQTMAARRSRHGRIQQLRGKDWRVSGARVGLHIITLQSANTNADGDVSAIRSICKDMASLKPCLPPPLKDRQESIEQANKEASSSRSLRLLL